MNRVGIFWDYENCAPPTGTPGYVVAERLRTACGAHGSVTQFRAYLELSVPQSGPSSQASHPTGADPSLNDLSCPSTSLKNLTLRSELQSSGISLIDCPHNSRKNVADSMLACDLVCFALDNPAVPQTPHANYIPSSPFSIPNTPFSAVSPLPLSLPKTTIVLISGDRDFAYPLAVLKARRYNVGLIVPPGGAHPALRAQASWVMNWKDVLEGTSALDGSQTVTASARGPAEGTSADGPSNSPNAHGQNARRSSFASRRGSVSGSRRGSISITPSSTLPPPPSMAETTPKASTSFTQAPSIPDFRDVAPTTAVRRPPPPPVHPPAPLEGPSTSQLPISSKLPRKSSIRRAAKATSRPPSRTKSRIGGKSARAERAEPEAPKVAKPEQPRPQPIIVPVPLTASPVGSVGQSFAGMSPRTQGRPQTPPLFSTNPTSPPPPAAPPALAPPPTPPTKALTPPVKPPTPPRDTTRPLQRPPIPHVATPRPPVPGSHHSTSANDQALEVPPPQDASTSAPAPVAPAPAPAPKTSMLQSLLPAAPALCPGGINPHRPPLTVPSLSIQTTSTNTLTPATPVTPPASPPFRNWARLQPVHDDTDADGDRPSSVNKKPKKGKEKAKEKAELGMEDSDAGAQHAPKTGRGPSKLAVQVGLLVKTGEEPSAISGVESILRSYAERTPNVEWDSRTGIQDDQNAPEHNTERNDEDIRPANPEEERGNNDDVDEDDDEEEKFHETFFATFSRSQPIHPNAPRTPPTVKVPALEFAPGDNSENAQDGGDGGRSRYSTPRPVPRSSHSMPTIPMMQSLLAGIEGNMVESRVDSRGERGIHDIDDASNMGERVYSRANSPPALPRRTTSLTTSIDLPKVSSPADLCISPSVESTYREFRFLINVLERWRRNGHDHPLRSLIGVEFSPDIFAQVGATSFKDYVQRAVAASVVTVGGGPIQGREWISLNRQWQGLGLVIE